MNPSIRVVMLLEGAQRTQEAHAIAWYERRIRLNPIISFDAIGLKNEPNNGQYFRDTTHSKKLLSKTKYGHAIF
jgi:hypothetical protein